MFDDTVLTPMPADIRPIERLYGGVKLNTGDTVYGNDAEIIDLAPLPAGLLGSYSAAFQKLLGEGRTNSERYLNTIKDDGGTDTLDLSRAYFRETIDLTITGPDAPLRAARNIVPMPDTVIDNSSGEQMDDRIIGNMPANTLNGNAGADWLNGFAGED